MLMLLFDPLALLSRLFEALLRPFALPPQPDHEPAPDAEVLSFEQYATERRRRRRTGGGSGPDARSGPSRATV